MPSTIIHRRTGVVLLTVEADTLGGADLREAYLGGAYLRGMHLNWQSHALMAELLLRDAGDDLHRQLLAGYVALPAERAAMCWKDLLALELPEALAAARVAACRDLVKWATDQSPAPTALTEWLAQQEAEAAR